MSGLDQPLVIANSCYHVGHERSVRVAEEQGYYKEEGLENYVYQAGGLVPGKWEFDVLGEQMWERGVDIATAVDGRAAIVQHARGEDVHIVGGWRTQLEVQMIAAKGITRPEQLQGVKAAGSGGRDSVGLMGMSWALHKFGVDPVRDIEWIPRPLTRYESDPRAGDVLRSGEVSLVTLSGHEADAKRLVAEGYPVVLDTEAFYKDFYKGLKEWPPGKVIVATKQTIEKRGAELRAFLRANVRAFWFVQDTRNYKYMFDLETRRREQTYNEYEHRTRMLASETPRAPRDGVRKFGMMPMDGLVPRRAVSDIIADLYEWKEIDHLVEVDDVLTDAASIDAYDDLVTAGRVDRQAVEDWRAINS